MVDPPTPAQPALKLQRTLFDIPVEVVEPKAARGRRVVAPKKPVAPSALTATTFSTGVAYGGPSCFCKGTGIVRRRTGDNQSPGIALNVWSFTLGTYVGMSYVEDLIGELNPAEDVPCPSCKDPSSMRGRVLVRKPYILPSKKKDKGKD